MTGAVCVFVPPVFCRGTRSRRETTRGLVQPLDQKQKEMFINGWRLAYLGRERFSVISRLLSVRVGP